MGSPNQPRDSHGRWAAGGSGSENGDHQSESPSTDTRNVAGHGNVPRSQVVAKHNGADSLGTEPPTLRIDQPVTRQQRNAKSDRIVAMRATDQRHFGIPGDVGNRVGKMLPSDLRGPSAKGWPFNN